MNAVRILVWAGLALALGGGGLVAAWAQSAATQEPRAAGTPPPAEHYARWPVMQDVNISPSGRRLALLQPGPGGYRRLAVLDLDPIGAPRVVAAFHDGDVRRVEWVNDDRLVFEAWERGAVISAARFGAWAVDHDGSRYRRLITGERSIRDTAATTTTTRMLPGDWEFHSTLDDGSSDVIVYRLIHDSIGEPVDAALARLDTLTGEVRNLAAGMPAHTWSWWLDPQGEPKLAMTSRNSVVGVHRRGASGWEKLVEWDRLADDAPGAFTPWHLDPDGSVVVTARRGTQALFRLDAATGKPEAQPLVAVAGFDLAPRRIVDTKTRRLVGAQLAADRPVTYWFDDKLDAVQRGIDGALPPGRTNRLYCGRCETSRFFVIRSSSDRQPGEYFLFDREKRTMQPIGAERPWIDESTQGRRTFHRVPARDGLSLPVYVTHPPGAADDQPLPTVVLVHGGPWVRGSTRLWSPGAQFLATRGWRVIEPEFRGSEGYGWRHFRAGFKQWGGAMQDDLVDALQWAVKQKLSDAQRACVMGASYGGYAALMAPIAHPGAFRCAVSFVGVTDIAAMYDINWSDFTEQHKQYGMPRLIGDRKADAELLARSSPLKRVAELKLPVLLGHGAEDRRVPIEHARSFVSAARSAGVAVEPVEYRSEGHGFFDPANETDWLERVAAFIGKAFEAPPAAPR